MKRVLWMAVAVAFICSCEKNIVTDDVKDDARTKKIRFVCQGDFGAPTFTDFGSITRATTPTDENLTDVWVFDFVGNDCVQTVHQASTDSNFGSPVLQLAYGDHHLYFVASRGTEPSVNATAKTITWTRPSDTFWKSVDVSVTSGSNSNRSVVLDRVTCKLKVSMNDEVPTGIASLSLTPANWYYALNYQTGEPAGATANQVRTVSVPVSYVGTTGQLSMSIFGLSSDTQWTTNFTIAAKDGNGATIGSASVAGAPFKRNRSTEYSGNLFVGGSANAITVNGEWDTPVTLSW